MKKVISLLVGISILVTAALAAFAQEPIRVIVDGEQLAFDVDPVIENDRTLVPMRLIFEALGADVKWDEASRTASAVKDEITVSITIDNAIMTKNGENVTLDAPARLIGGRTLVPVRAVSEGLGAEVEWDSASRTVKVSTLQDVPVEPPRSEEQSQNEEQSQPENRPSEEHEDQIPDGFVHYAELSETDMETLKSRYNNLIRYYFEQVYLPRAVLVEDTAFAQEIRAKSDYAIQLAGEIWNKVVISHILEIQSNSETNYYVGDLSTEADLYEAYMQVVKEAELEAERYFDVSFETLQNGYPMMLVTFKETDTLLACKYLGVVAMPDNTVRYFTAETDLVDKENLYFCEVTKDRRGTIGQMGFGKEEFIQCAWITIENDLSMTATLERKL